MKAAPALEAVRSAVTALFVPGNRPERFVKAAAAGAGVVIIDLEDAVADEAKDLALASALQVLGSNDSRDIRAIVRVDAMDTPQFEEQASALIRLACLPGNRLQGIMVAKSEDPAAIHELASRMADTGRDRLALIPLIETARGLIKSDEIVRLPGVTRLAFGAIDFALDIGADGSDRSLDYARSTLVTVSRAARTAAPLDSPSTELKDAQRISESARSARNLGFGGKLCIHPAQVVAVESAFAPSRDEVQWAETVVKAKDGVDQIDGHMIDRPVVERAKLILAQSRHIT